MYVPTFPNMHNRGLPHAHIILRLSNVASKSDRAGQAAWIKKHICTIVPRLGEGWGDDDIDYELNSKFVQNKWPQSEITNKPRWWVCRELVRSHHLHKCSSSKINGCKRNGICTRGYDGFVLNDSQVTFDRLGFPIYARKHSEDLKVVATNMVNTDNLHNTFIYAINRFIVFIYTTQGILEDWQGHCNVEYCGSNYTPVYLYKYVFKGMYQHTCTKLYPK